MRLLKLIWDEVFGMFVNDGALALQAVVLIAVVTGAVKLLGLLPLLGSCIAVLAFSLLRKTRNR